MSIRVPKKCLRKTDCLPLSQIQSDCKSSFVCCGYSSIKSRKYKQDKFRVCWKSDDVDEVGDYDKTDILDTLSVLAQALSIDNHIKGEKNG